jgi:methylenetetrahydrofolate reductase (NADPH)
VVVTDLHVRPRDRTSLDQAAATLAGTCDAVLVGDHGGRRNDFPPSYMAARLVALGVRPWVTLSCRDRNRVALAAECAALADLGVAGVHCVTGDWEGLAGGVGESRVFDLDALRLVALAVEHGLPVSVAAAPASPPVDLRPRRLAEKAAAGATTCFVNHCGGPEAVARFVGQALDAGAGMAYLPCVPVVSDRRSRVALARLPGLVLDREVIDAVERNGSAPEAGIAAAAVEAARMMAIPGVVGVNLSGAASTRSEHDSAVMMADLGRRIQASTTTRRPHPGQVAGRE